MRIGVDACCWSNQRGFGRFTRELLTELLRLDRENEYWLFADENTAAQNKLPDTAHVVTVPTDVPPVEAASASGRRSLADLWTMTRHVLKHKLDLFFFPAIYSYFPILNLTAVAVTIHDMIPADHPESVFAEKRLQFFWNLKEFAALKQADMILTVSEYSKKQILKHHRLPESRVRVITEGSSPIFRPVARDGAFHQILQKHRIGAEDRFLLYVGGISPHKNLKTLIKAYAHLQSDSNFSDVKLILVGDYKNDPFYSDYPALKQQAEQLQLRDKIYFAGFVEDSDLVCLYNAASVMVLPSLQEGFGLPAMEALACGAPVCASCTGSLPEILGEAAQYFDPYSPDEMYRVIRNILEDSKLRKRMQESGLQRAGRFSWIRASEDTLAVFREMVKR